MKIINTNAFGKMVRERRKKLGYTQQYIHEVTGISASFLSDLENGKATIELGKAIHIANLLGLDMELKERN